MVTKKRTWSSPARPQHQLATPNGSFTSSFPGEEEKDGAICGKAVLNKIRKNQSCSRQQQERKRQQQEQQQRQPQQENRQEKSSARERIGGRSFVSTADSRNKSDCRKTPSPYEEVTGSTSTSSPETISSSEGSENRDEVVESQPDGSMPPYILQFDPCNQLSGGGGASSSEYETGGQEEQKDTERMHVIQQLSLRQGSPWATTLPSVIEERSFEVEEMQSQDTQPQQQPYPQEQPSASSPSPAGKQYSTQEKNDMLLAMRSLVLKQQAVIKDLSDENSKWRYELDEAKASLAVSNQEKSSLRIQNEHLTVEKENTEAELAWLREEIHAMKRELLDLKQEDQIQEKFRRLLEDSTRASPSVGTNSVASSRTEQRPCEAEETFDDDSSFQKYNVALSEIARSTVQAGSEWDAANGIYDPYSNQKPPLPDGRDNTHIRGYSNNHRRNDSAGEQRVLFSSSSSAASPPPTAAPDSSSPIASRLSADSRDSKEEVALFKSRLESIQNKRKYRQYEQRIRNSGSPVVRFGPTT